MTVRFEKQQGVAIVTLDRPSTKNAITMEMRRLLWEAFEEIALDSAIRSVILTGAGGNFSSGMDVGGMGTAGVVGSMERMHTLHRIARAIYHLKKPTIAAVPGICAGVAWSYAMCCDIVLAADNARFSQIFRNIGLTPDGGAVWLLRQQIGAMRAKEIVYSGRMVSAEEALSLGLTFETVPADRLMDRALELATSFAQGPTIAMGLAKRQFALAAAAGFDEFLEMESAMQPVASRTHDHEEGLAAFREKRKPNFTGS
jgi:2-(1,2-epoxy-1,2-dihydrophenyl)acetyl-CoA isomerase